MNMIYKFLKVRFSIISVILIFTNVKSVVADFDKSTQINVFSNVIPFCSINANPLAFHGYRMNVVTASTSILVICTTGTKYSISLDYGKNSDNNLRKMTFNNNSLNYQLYQDDKMNIIWGNNQDNSLTGLGNGQTQIYKVYGLIPAKQIAPSGLYNDVISVNINMFDTDNNSNINSYQMMVRMNVTTNKL